MQPNPRIAVLIIGLLTLPSLYAAESVRINKLGGELLNRGLCYSTTENAFYAVISYPTPIEIFIPPNITRTDYSYEAFRISASGDAVRVPFVLIPGFDGFAADLLRWLNDSFYFSSSDQSWIYTSETTHQWSSFRWYDCYALLGLAYGGGIYSGVGRVSNQPLVVRSLDGQTWSRTNGTIQGNPTGCYLEAVAYGAYGGGIFAAVGTKGTILISDDGASWVTRNLSSPYTDSLNGVCYGNGYFVAVGDFGQTVTGAGGPTWEVATKLATLNHLNAVCYGDGLFVAVGNTGTWMTSADGKAWSVVRLGTFREDITDVAYGGGAFVGITPQGSVVFHSTKPTYTITASAGPGGTISPSGTIAKSSGESQTFTATANAGYVVDQWRVNGSAVPAAGTTYTLSNIQADRTVHVTFTTAPPYRYTIQGGAVTITEYTGPGGAVTIPGTIAGLPVTRIGDVAFIGAWSVTSVTIPNGVTSIGEYAFGNCMDLTAVTIPNTVTSIEEGGFESCRALTSVTIPNSVASIGDYAFSNCSSLTSVAIPNSVTSMGRMVFYGCSGLTTITVGSQNPAYRGVGGVLFNRSQTVLVQYPVGKTGSYTVPSGVTAIADGAFATCPGLTAITIPSSVTAIEDEAFSVCTNLTSVTIPDSVRNIGALAFWFCTGLIEVTIGSGVGDIGDEAFYSCWSLRSVYCRGNAPVPGTDVFDGITQATVYYLAGTTGWGPTFAGLPTALMLTQYRVTPSAGSNGSISPSTPQTVSQGGSVSFTATPNANYMVKEWLVDNHVVQTGGNSYTLSNIQADLPVRVMFTRVPPTYRIAASAGVGGAISPSGTITKSSGESQTFTASPSANYIVNQWRVNGSLVKTGGTTYTLSDIRANRSVEVTFTYLPYTYEVTSGAVTITRYTGPGGAETVPSKIGGLPVTRIGDDAFGSCGGLTRVTIPNSVTSIGYWGLFELQRSDRHRDTEQRDEHWGLGV